jgi:hypothetical protein
MGTYKIAFSKLIGNEYSLEIKMNVLDWMLKTGKEHTYRSGWYVNGVSQQLFGYSANNHDYEFRLPEPYVNFPLKTNTIDLSLFFDAIFTRAIYEKPYQSVKNWREKERIHPQKYRMLKFNTNPSIDLSQTISSIQKLKGKLLKKEYHHPEYADRTYPKILKIKLYTTGNGWVVTYDFSFKECPDSSWTKEFCQKEDESIAEFLSKTYNKLLTMIEEE